MNVDIYIKERNGSREIRLPILPEKIHITSGGVIMATYDILNVGEVAYPTGTGLGGISWECMFPGKYQKDLSIQRGKWQDPSSYLSTLADWKAKGTALTVLGTNLPLNMDVYLKDYNPEPYGAFGNVAYDIEFTEDKFSSAKISKPKSSGTTTTKRTAAETSSYTIKTGDTLWAIAQRFLGSGAKWETIYNANKDIIEQTAKKYGKSSSDHGWWIYPGVTLTIPK